MKAIKLLLLVLTVATVITSCQKDDVPGDNPEVTKGLYVLSEGNFSGNSTKLTYYDLGNNTATTDFYHNANGSDLGNTGNDILLYGSKLYIAVNVSSYVEVAYVVSAVSIKKIPFKTPGGADRQPRYIVPYKNKVLVSSWDGTVAVIDTASLNIDRFITVGSNPEQMAVVGDRLYVANSGGISPEFDSTVSVVNLINFTETQKITVGVNPGFVTADDNGNIYVGTIGNFFDQGPKLVKINTATNTVVKSADTAVGKMQFHDGFLYATGGYFGSGNVRKLNTTDFGQASANFVTDGTSIAIPYGINVDQENGDVYVTDAKDFTSSGEVFCFDKDGKKKFSFSVAPAANPNTTVFIRR